MKRGVTMILLIVILALLALAVYFLFFYKVDCRDDECFSDSLLKCRRASYMLENNETLTLYNIEGKSGANCKVNVKLLQLKKGSLELEVLEGKDMDCFVETETLIMPDADINKCHGLLKEEIQDQVIQRMHRQIIENMDSIDQDINKII